MYKMIIVDDEPIIQMGSVLFSITMIMRLKLSTLPAREKKL